MDALRLNIVKLNQAQLSCCFRFSYLSRLLAGNKSAFCAAFILPRLVVRQLRARFQHDKPVASPLNPRSEERRVGKECRL